MARRATAFELKGASFPLPALRLLSGDLDALREGLREKVASAPGMLRNAPLVIDLGGLRDGTLDLQRLTETIREQGMIPVGVCNGNEIQERAAAAVGLGVLQARHTNGRGSEPAEARAKAAPITVPAAPPVAEPAPAPAAPEPARAARIVEAPVRSGQKIYARQGDLVLLGGVNHGAEVIADGHIHAYGPLRGRAIAGAAGDERARIFCRGLEAELVAIAGIYRVFEEPDESLRRRRVQIVLNGDRLEANPI